MSTTKRTTPNRVPHSDREPTALSVRIPTARALRADDDVPRVSPSGFFVDPAATPRERVDLDPAARGRAVRIVLGIAYGATPEDFAEGPPAAPTDPLEIAEASAFVDLLADAILPGLGRYV